MASPSCKYVNLWSRNCHEILYVQTGQIHQNIDEVLNFWTHLSNLTQSPAWYLTKFCPTNCWQSITGTYIPAFLTNFEWDWLWLPRTDFSRSKEGISNLCTTRLWIKPLSLLVRSFWQILFYFITLAKMTWPFCVSLGRLYAGQNSANMASVPRNPKQIVLKKRTGKKNIRKQ